MAGLQDFIERSKNSITHAALGKRFIALHNFLIEQIFWLSHYVSNLTWMSHLYHSVDLCYA